MQLDRILSSKLDDHMLLVRTWRLCDVQNVSAAAKAHGIEHLYFTLRRRIQGTTLPKADAHGSQQLLSRAEEETLVDWMKYLALTGHPLNARTIRPKVQAILAAKGSRYAADSKHPSKSWIRKF